MAISEIHNIDCMIAMKEFPDKFFDLAIVDPPYGLSMNDLKPGSNISSTGVARKQHKQGLIKLTMNKPGPEYFTELLRVSKNQIIWGENYFPNLGPGRIVWVKNNPLLSGAELAYCSFGIGVYVFEYTWSGYIQGNNGINSKENRIHPTQKPIALYKWLLKNYAKEGDKILDTHLGSGSSRIAAYDMGFDFWGCELDKDYFDASVKRFSEFKAQQKLFA